MGISRTLTAMAMLAATAGVGLEAKDKIQPRMREEITVRAVYPQFTNEYLVTFKSPLSLPGASLGSGTYLFRRVTTGAIQVISANRKTTYAMVQTIPAFRDTANLSHVFMFKAQTVAGAPHRLTHWFLPGNATGHEILYPPGRVSTLNDE